jgi:hypothetical protein
VSWISRCAGRTVVQGSGKGSQLASRLAAERREGDGPTCGVHERSTEGMGR